MFPKEWDWCKCFQWNWIGSHCPFNMEFYSQSQCIVNMKSSSTTLSKTHIYSSSARSLTILERCLQTVLVQRESYSLSHINALNRQVPICSKSIIDFQERCFVEDLTDRCRQLLMLLNELESWCCAQLDEGFFEIEYIDIFIECLWFFE